ncbi:hypothetical protein [Saccharophagus sp. K07]|uniref:hypothetical protein n=1 Tax=Saccharophagus sp. K07 TaxID=2283636 RepID=UPI00210683C6|nr:hypothetical protein [Saccharophagus sp. K07]
MTRVKAALKSLKKSVRAYYQVPMEVSFRQFRAGLIYFAVGLGTVLMANNYMEPSVTQELVVLGGLVLGGIGFIVALLGQSRLLVSRLLRFWLKDR